MIIIKVELHSAITGNVTEIGRMTIANDGTGTPARGNYIAKIMRKGTTNEVTRTAEVKNHPRKSYPIWNLISKALKELYK